jgi:glycosyltransferase involved in cell wall biosynthesis
MPFVRDADAIAGLGNAVTADTWRAVTPAPFLAFPNHAFPEIQAPRRSSAARSHFLFLASHPQVLKGLDWVLDVFSRHPELHLHVCSRFADEPDFCGVYARHLFRTANIHPVGWVPIHGPRFYEVAGACAFVLHPSCADAQPGSVVHAMRAGLVPIVTAICGLPTRGLGLTLAQESLPALEQAVLTAARLSPEAVATMSAAARAATDRTYSEEAFARRWNEILDGLPPSASAARP